MWNWFKRKFLTPDPGLMDETDVPLTAASVITPQVASVVQAARFPQPEYFDLALVNRRRRDSGRRGLTRAEAEQAVSSRTDSEDSVTEFLIGYVTGFPYPSGAGVIGAVLHDEHSVAQKFTQECSDTSSLKLSVDSDTSSSSDQSSSMSSYDSGSSSDSSSSSSSYDSGSSSSSDSSGW